MSQRSVELLKMSFNRADLHSPLAITIEHSTPITSLFGQLLVVVALCLTVLLITHCIVLLTMYFAIRSNDHKVKKSHTLSLSGAWWICYHYCGNLSSIQDEQ